MVILRVTNYPVHRSRPKLNYGAGRVGNSHRPASPRPTTLEEDRKLFVDFSSILCLQFETQAMRTYNFFDWVSNTDSEPRGNNRSFPGTRDRARVPVKKIGSRDSIFGLVNSTYLFKITNHKQHAFNIKYLANLNKKYWTCFRYQKLADFLVCLPPSVPVQVRWLPSWKICLRIQLSFGFWGRAVMAFDNFSRKLAWLLQTIFQKFWSRDLSPPFSKMEI